jgi:hypothetical protein
VEGQAGHRGDLPSSGAFRASSAFPVSPELTLLARHELMSFSPVGEFRRMSGLSVRVVLTRTRHSQPP